MLCLLLTVHVFLIQILKKKYSRGLIIQIELTAEKKEVNLSLLNSRHGENRKIWHDVYSLYPCKCKVF